MKKITRTIETVTYAVTLFDKANKQIEVREYTDMESLSEKDLTRALNYMLSAKGDTRKVVDIEPVGASSGLYEMPVDIFLKYATKVERRTVEDEPESADNEPESADNEPESADNE